MPWLNTLKHTPNTQLVPADKGGTGQIYQTQMCMEGGCTHERVQSVLRESDDAWFLPFSILIGCDNCSTINAPIAKSFSMMVRNVHCDPTVRDWVPPSVLYILKVEQSWSFWRLSCSLLGLCWVINQSWVVGFSNRHIRASTVDAHPGLIDVVPPLLVGTQICKTTWYGQ